LSLDESASLPEDVRAAFEELKDKTGPVAVLDENLKAILRDALKHTNAAGAGGDLLAKIERGLVADLTAGERHLLVVGLMLARNKVTHICELVKAYGSTIQVTYDRPTRRWLRTDSIAAKHALEYSVNPLDGSYGVGAEHAPLLYADDPRKNVPSKLQAYMVATLKDCDPRIIAGWLTAITTGIGDEMALE
jgi:hypothetical protein